MQNAQIPPASVIELATDGFNMQADLVLRELRELEVAISDPIAARLAIAPGTNSFKVGYALGLAVARHMLAASVALQAKGIRADQLL